MYVSFTFLCVFFPPSLSPRLRRPLVVAAAFSLPLRHRVQQKRFPPIPRIKSHLLINVRAPESKDCHSAEDATVQSHVHVHGYASPSQGCHDVGARS